MKRTISYFRNLFSVVFRIENVVGVVIGVTIIAVSLNTSSVILQNYQLEREVRTANQKVSIAEIELANQRLNNQYFQTDAFLEIAARKQLSKGVNGEKLVIVPKSVALAQVPTIAEPEIVSLDVSKSDLSNFERWVKFVSGDLEYISQD